MKAYLGILNKERGEDFNEKVYEYLCTFPNSIVDKKVGKINGIRINDSNNNTLGDIDVLFISKKFKRIIVCEVKNFELSIFSNKSLSVIFFNTSDAVAGPNKINNAATF